MKTSRRAFLAQSSLAAAAMAQPACAGMLVQESAGSLVSGKDDRLLVLKKFPAVLETPLPLLAQQQLTPKGLLFVRNNQQPDDAATMAPSQKGDWTLRLTGGINKSASISLQQLREMEMTDYEMVLQCSGNGRSLFSKAAQTSGTQWGKGGMGNVRFAGVRLSKVLDKLGVEPNKSVRFVNASGADEPLPEKEDFLHSLPALDAINHSIIALNLNGEPLPAIHGGPLRLITPGVYATMNVKWLSELNFVDTESDNYNHLPRYRVPKQSIKPGADYEFSFENSRYNWNMKIKSVLLSPNDGDTVKAGQKLVKGVAFNDGSSRITAVYVSSNHGETWVKAKLAQSSSLYAWTQFEAPLQLAAGKQTIWCRAIDAVGRTQPLNGSLAWNPRGYEWNGIEQVTVEAIQA